MDKESKHQLEQHVSDVLDLFTAGECEPRMFIAALVCSIARLAANWPHDGRLRHGDGPGKAFCPGRVKIACAISAHLDRGERKLKYF